MGKVYFISDLHLGSLYPNDNQDIEKKVVRWLDIVKNDAEAIYFLGDIFDYWYEYKYVAPRGYVRFLGKLAELSDSGVAIHFLIGNHDIWMFGYLSSEVGAIIHLNPFVAEYYGKKFFLAHGDEVGWQPFTYRLIQSVFRNRFCQWLYSAIHPRWTFAFAQRWSAGSRKKSVAAGMQEQIETKALKNLEVFSGNYLKTHPDIDFFIYGHLHIVVNEELTDTTARLLVTGDWLNHFSYAEWDGVKIEMKTFI